MASVRRATLIGGLLVVAAAGMTHAPVGVLRLRAAAAASGLVIDNMSAAPVAIDRTIGVEQWTDGRWTPLRTEMKAIAACTAQGAIGPVRLPPRTSLSVVPWRGGSCSGQCTYTCRANIDYPPGRFRFVVTTLPEHAQLTGPAFRLDHSL